ncbi:MAG: hypothetical protein HRT45_09105 [Bdellovibrionales bacterium]|nr:hypothetical protein [Bdellovibrionales bacterium]
MIEAYGYETCSGEPLMVPADRSTGAGLVWKFRDYMLSRCRRHREGSGFGLQNQAGFEVNMPIERFEELR